MKITSTIYPKIGEGEILVIRNKFDPNQPRDPKGESTGGQWTGTGQGSRSIKTIRPHNPIA